jgi:hypothetical protein
MSGGSPDASAAQTTANKRGYLRFVGTPSGDDSSVEACEHGQYDGQDMSTPYRVQVSLMRVCVCVSMCMYVCVFV